MHLTGAFSWPGEARAAVSLSFDDARPSQVDAGIPILNRHGIRGSFYASPRNLDDRLEGWRAAVAAGHEIGNHTMSHPCSGNFAWSRENALEDYTLERMADELAESDRVIEEKLEVRPLTFAYPCGQTFVGRGENTTSYIPLIAKRFLAGRAFNAEVPNDPAFCDLAHLGDTGIDDRPFDKLKSWLDAAARNGGWVIFCGHDVGKGGFQFTIAEELDRLCAHLVDKGNGFWVATVSEAARWIRRSRGVE